MKLKGAKHRASYSLQDKLHFHYTSRFNDPSGDLFKTKLEGPRASPSVVAIIPRQNRSIFIPQRVITDYSWSPFSRLTSDITLLREQLIWSYNKTKFTESDTSNCVDRLRENAVSNAIRDRHTAFQSFLPRF